MGKATTNVNGMKHIVTRREALRLSLAFAAAGAAVLSGCKKEEDKEPENPFDRNDFTVMDAFGDRYPAVLAAAQQTAPDVVPIAIRSTSTVEPGGATVWDYLFASQEEHSYYVAFTRTDPVVARMGASYVKGTEWAQIPLVDDIMVDAAQAYGIACDLAEKEGLPRAGSLFAFLTLFSESSDGTDAAYAYEDEGMTWYFEFNPTVAENSGPGYVENLGKEAPEPEPAPRMFCIAVNAVTGEAAVVAR